MYVYPDIVRQTVAVKRDRNKKVEDQVPKKVVRKEKKLCAFGCVCTRGKWGVCRKDVKERCGSTVTRYVKCWDL